MVSHLQSRLLNISKRHKAVKNHFSSKKEDATLRFKNYKRSMKVPFIVYADFEAFAKPVHTCQPNPEHSYTKQYQKHIPSSFCYYIKCFDDTIYPGKLVSTR